MTRKARRPSDSTNTRATSELSFQQLKDYIDQIVSDLSPIEAGVLRQRYGLDDGQLRTWDELGEMFGVTRGRIRQIELKAFQRLKNRHGGEAETALHGLLDTDYSGLPRHIKESVLGHPVQLPWWELDGTPVFCERHQTNHLLEWRDKQCGWCNCVAPRGRNGRPRKYCSNPCRQAAYRKRRRDASTAPGSDQPSR